MWASLPCLATFVLVSRGFVLPLHKINPIKRFEAASRVSSQSPPPPSPAESSCSTLAFVNRYAETLDVFFTNLQNQENVMSGQRAKMRTPLACQPPGTGKTALGKNLIAVLQRPDTLGSDISQRLLNAWCWRILGPENTRSTLAQTVNVVGMSGENIIMRTLGALFPRHISTLKKLKESKPVVCELKSLVKSRELEGFDDALGLLLFSAATGIDDFEEYAKFMKSTGRLRTSQGVAKSLIEQRGPMFIILDDITDLALGTYDDYFDKCQGATSHHRAMTELSTSLQNLHSIPGCFVYCTGHSFWPSTVALGGGTSALRVTPIILQPMTAEDALSSMKLTPGMTPGAALSEELGMDAKLLPTFAELAVRVTGGVGLGLERLIRARQQYSEPATSQIQLTDQIEALFPLLQDTPGLMLQIKWDGPIKAAGDIQLKLIRFFCRALLLDLSFSPTLQIRVGNALVRLSDAAAVFGLSYSLVESRPGIVAAPLELRLVAGEWLCRSFLTDSFIQSDPASMAAATLQVRLPGGIFKGRPFALLCVDAFCARAMKPGSSSIREMFPHLSEASISVEVLQKLHVIAIPKVTVARKSVLSDSDKAKLILSRRSWTGMPSINPVDLPWLLCNWLQVGDVAVPTDAQSESQDWFIRIEKGVIGVANKATKSDGGTKWGDLREEILKAPRLCEGFEYTLVVWALHAAPELSAVLQGSGALVCRSGLFATGGENLIVPDHIELVVANPKVAISELIGAPSLHKLDESDFTGQPDPLADWMQK